MQSSEPGAEEETGVTSGLNHGSCSHVVASRLQGKRGKGRLPSGEFLCSDLKEMAAGGQELKVGMFVSTLICPQNGPPCVMKAVFIRPVSTDSSGVQCK